MSKELDNELTKKAFEEDVFYTDSDYESDLDDALAYGNDEDVNAVHEKYNKAYAKIEEKYGMKIDDLREEHMKAAEIESERLKNERIMGDGKRPLPNVGGLTDETETQYE